jgi:hypothetical protein
MMPGQPSPFRPKEYSDEKYVMEVFVDKVEESGAGGGVASFLQGHVVYNGEKFPFEAIAYGRIGGQNVSPNLTEESMKRLQELDVDLEVFSSILQRKLVEGDMTLEIPPGTPPPDLSTGEQ